MANELHFDRNCAHTPEACGETFSCGYCVVLDVRGMASAFISDAGDSVTKSHTAAHEETWSPANLASPEAGCLPHGDLGSSGLEQA